MPALHRRNFLRSMPAFASLPLPGFSSNRADKGAAASNRFKLSLNAYSFNAPLTGGKATLDQVVEFCAANGFDAVDLTGYYFPGYPQTPSDEYVYHLKKKTHQLGLSVSGTGIRNDFVQESKEARAADEMLVKKWIETAAKLGAPVIRIYTGKALVDESVREKITAQVAEHIHSCVEWGKAHGVLVAIQNHNDFIKTAGQAIQLLKLVNSEWFGLVLDTGSFVTGEPYAEIALAAPYAVNWQVKEKFAVGGQQQNMDLPRLCKIIRDSTYRGFLPIETLNPGDPFVIVPPFLQQVKQALAAVMKTA
ncbi:MAG: sugar phosphate isomerase/epimerase [Williamsia sp.]|nr:sugar phosphate isomerase/epimerase [Williamsia sp.]